MKGKLYFYFLRLRNSTLFELIYRAKQFHFLKKLKRQVIRNKNLVPAPKIDHKNVGDLKLPSFHGRSNNKLIQKILGGELYTLNTDIDTIRKFEKYHQKIFFTDIKSFDRQPDIRTVWEPARLQHLVILLNYLTQIGNSSDIKDVKQFVKNSVISWIHKNPFLFGPHYISAMECGLRVPVFFYCIKILDNLDAPETQHIFDTIYKHGWWISKRLSLYSSLGNHTIAECVGLIFAGATFRYTKEGNEWLKTGGKLLKKELDHQILGDGGPAEQSFSYHRFVLDLYWLAIDLLEGNDLYDCGEFKERLIQAERFIAAFENKNNSLPSIGDSDDGCAVAPGIYPHRIRSPEKNDGIQTFSISGYTIINCNNAVLTFDHGPLGMAPLYNHGHADALSITFSVDGKEMLVDTGTYRYNGEPEFRKYFKGTRAHNTVTIDSLDQAVQETGFIWSQAYVVELIKSKEITGGYFLLASHDGYERIKDPVRHFRSVISSNNEYFFVKDTFSGQGVHDFELNFHIHPDSEIILEDNGWWKINRQQATIYVRLLNGNNLSVIKGQTEPIFGWYSPAYGIKNESGVLSCTRRGNSNEVSFITAICMKLPSEPISLFQKLFKIEQQIENS